MTKVSDLYKMFMENSFVVTSYTSEKSSNIAYRFWSLMIVAGIKFNVNELVELEKWCQEDRYRPVFYGPNENHYALAVHENHISFCNSYEKYKKRKPFIGKNIDYVKPYGAVTVHQTQARTRGRLVIGCSFKWKGFMVTVTSFKDSSNSLIACSYKPKKDWHEPSKIDRRFTITHKEWRDSKKDGDKEKSCQ